MDCVVRNVVEPWFETILKRLIELEKKINTIDTKITKMEYDILILGCKLETKLSANNANNANNSKMEEVD